MDQENEYKGRAHKPKSSHPWKNAVKPDVARWAYEKSNVTPTNNVRVAKISGLTKQDGKNTPRAF